MKKFLFVLVVVFCWGQKAQSQTQEIIVYFENMTDAQVDNVRITQFNNALELGRTLPSDCRLWQVTLPIQLLNGTLTYNVADVFTQNSGTNATNSGGTVRGGGSNGSGAFQTAFQGSSPYTDIQGIEQYSDVPSYVLNCGGESAPSLGAASNTTSGQIRIALIDSGVNINHQYFNRLIGQEGLSSDFFVDPYSFVNGSNNFNVDDPIGHGTHIAGLMAHQALGINHGNNNIRLMPIQIMDLIHGVSDPWKLIRAIDYAINHDASIINMSLCFPNTSSTFVAGTDSPLEHAIAKAMGEEVVVVCAAGNDFSPLNSVLPAGYTNHHQDLIVVGSYAEDPTSHRPVVSDFSNYGPYVDIFAPGQELIYPSTGTNYYNIMKGTSMAAGWVTGALAVMMEKGLEYSDILDIIKNSPVTMPDRDGHLRPVFDLSSYCETPFQPGNSEDTRFSPRLSQSVSPSTYSVYPNPTNNHINVEISTDKETTFYWELYSIEGRKVSEGNEVFSGAITKTIDLPVQAGVYNLRIKYGDELRNIPVYKH